MNPILNTFPTIKTERLVLRKLKVSDVDDLYALYNSAETQRFQNKHYYSRDSLIEYILIQDIAFNNGEQIIWAIERISDNAFIGVRILYCDEGSDFMEIQGDTKSIFWKQGYTKEAYKGILSFLKNKNIEGVYAKINSENSNATFLIKSIGFTLNRSYIENDLIFNEFVLDLSLSN